MQRYANADPDRIGMWGHSMGGNITLRALVIDPRIKVAVIWAGVTATYYDMLYNWHPAKYGTPDQNARRSRPSIPPASLARARRILRPRHGRRA